MAMALIAHSAATAMGAPTRTKATLPPTTLAVNNPAVIGIANRKLRATSKTARRLCRVDAESHQIGFRRPPLTGDARKSLKNTAAYAGGPMRAAAIPAPWRDIVPITAPRTTATRSTIAGSRRPPAVRRVVSHSFQRIVQAPDGTHRPRLEAAAIGR